MNLPIPTRPPDLMENEISFKTVGESFCILVVNLLYIVIKKSTHHPSTLLKVSQRVNLRWRANRPADSRFHSTQAHGRYVSNQVFSPDYGDEDFSVALILCKGCYRTY